jgi:WD40 repeat protein
MTVLSSSETRLILLNLRAGREVRGFVGHRSVVTCLREDSASQRFLGASYDGSVMLWDIASRTCLKTCHMDGGCRDFVSFFCVCWHALHAVCGYESGCVELRSFDSDSSVTVLRKECHDLSISCIAVDWAREKFAISFNRNGCLVVSDLTSLGLCLFPQAYDLAAHRLCSPVVCL